MKTLALELSSSRGGIAFRDGENECFVAEFPNDRKHSGEFFGDLERCIQQCGAPEQIVVGLGPGSYAGTRIAIAAAIGLQAAMNARLFGIPSVCAFPTPASEYAVIGDARRQSFFFARVRQRECVQGPELCSNAELRDRLTDVVFPIFSTEPMDGFSRSKVLHPSAVVLAQITSGRPAETTSAPLEPIYLREPHITQPKAATR